MALGLCEWSLLYADWYYFLSLAFPLHIMLLWLPSFPFLSAGLIHVNNQIKQFKPIEKDEKLSVSSCFDDLRFHFKGWLFSISVEFYCGSEHLWQCINTNLFRANHGHFVYPTNQHSMFNFINPIILTYKLSANLGLRYAKVSGDFNPIHLNVSPLCSGMNWTVYENKQFKGVRAWTRHKPVF
jgi:hypothetical protein